MLGCLHRNPYTDTGVVKIPCSGASIVVRYEPCSTKSSRVTEQRYPRKWHGARLPARAPAIRTFLAAPPPAAGAVAGVWRGSGARRPPLARAPCPAAAAPQRRGGARREEDAPVPLPERRSSASARTFAGSGALASRHGRHRSRDTLAATAVRAREVRLAPWKIRRLPPPASSTSSSVQSPITRTWRSNGQKVYFPAYAVADVFDVHQLSAKPVSEL